MDQDLKNELKRLRRLALLNFAEIQQLKKGLILKDDVHEYANSLREYMEGLDAKERNLVKDYPALAD